MKTFDYTGLSSNHDSDSFDYERRELERRILYKTTQQQAHSYVKLNHADIKQFNNEFIRNIHSNNDDFETQQKIIKGNSGNLSENPKELLKILSVLSDDQAKHPNSSSKTKLLYGLNQDTFYLNVKSKTDTDVSVQIQNQNVTQPKHHKENNQHTNLTKHDNQINKGLLLNSAEVSQKPSQSVDLPSQQGLDEFIKNPGLINQNIETKNQLGRTQTPQPQSSTHIPSDLPGDKAEVSQKPMQRVVQPSPQGLEDITKNPDLVNQNAETKNQLGRTQTPQPQSSTHIPSDLPGDMAEVSQKPMQRVVQPSPQDLEDITKNSNLVNQNAETKNQLGRTQVSQQQSSTHMSSNLPGDMAEVSQKPMQRVVQPSPQDLEDITKNPDLVNQNAETKNQLGRTQTPQPQSSTHIPSDLPGDMAEVSQKPMQRVVQPSPQDLEDITKNPGLVNQNAETKKQIGKTQEIQLQSREQMPDDLTGKVTEGVQKRTQSTGQSLVQELTNSGNNLVFNNQNTPTKKKSSNINQEAPVTENLEKNISKQSTRKSSMQDDMVLENKEVVTKKNTNELNSVLEFDVVDVDSIDINENIILNKNHVELDPSKLTVEINKHINHGRLDLEKLHREVLKLINEMVQKISSSSSGAKDHVISIKLNNEILDGSQLILKESNGNKIIFIIPSTASVRQYIKFNINKLKKNINESIDGESIQMYMLENDKEVYESEPSFSRN